MSRHLIGWVLFLNFNESSFKQIQSISRPMYDKNVLRMDRDRSGVSETDVDSPGSAGVAFTKDPAARAQCSEYIIHKTDAYFL